MFCLYPSNKPETVVANRVIKEMEHKRRLFLQLYYPVMNQMIELSISLLNRLIYINYNFV